MKVVKDWHAFGWALVLAGAAATLWFITKPKRQERIR